MNFKNILYSLSLFLLVVSCKTAGANNENIKLISPAENLQLCDSKKYLYESKVPSESIYDIRACVVVNQLKIISSFNGIYIFDTLTKKEIKSYKYKFDSLDLELLWVSFTINKDKSKLLVITSSGQGSTALIFQIDLATLNIDWLNEYAYQIRAFGYSNNLSLLAVGTSYHKKETDEYTQDYYASLFLLDTHTGKFNSYFEQGESVAQVKFSEDDRNIYSVLDWPHVDTYVWNVDNKSDKIGTFGKDQISFYDASYYDKNTFVTIGSDGIYKWNISDPEDYKIVYLNYINAGDKLYKLGDIFLLVDYVNGTSNPPIIKYFDKQFNLSSSYEMKTHVENFSISDMLLIGVDKGDNIVYFDIKNKSVRVEKRS
jgi:hypothetical protein